MKNWVWIFTIIFPLISFSQRDSCNIVYGKESSILIFSGRVIKTRIAHIDGKKLEARFEVDSVFKGELPKEYPNNYLGIYTNTNDYFSYLLGPCKSNGIVFIENKRYLVYVCSFTNYMYTTSKCTFTKEITYTEVPLISNDFYQNK